VQDIFDYARKTRYRLLSRLSVNPPPEVAQLLKIPEGAKVMQYRGVRSQMGRPFVYTATWLLMNLGEQIRAEEIRSSPIVVLIESLCGVEIAEVQQRTTAILAPREVATVLDVPVRSPILLVRRLYFSREGVPVDFAVNYFTAQRFEYHQRLMRFRHVGHGRPRVSDAGVS
jgi:DNA-binding GntR family transcriptional regulator